MHPLRIPIAISEEDGRIAISGSVPPISEWESADERTMAKVPRGPGCYALFRKGELIYVGESDCIADRLKGHNKLFDSCAWLRLDGAQRYVVEKMLIWHYMPEDNKELKRHDYRMRLKEEMLHA